jgi:hypothetical protein
MKKKPIAIKLDDIGHILVDHFKHRENINC